MFLTRLNKVKRVISRQINHGDEVCAIHMDNDDIIFQLSYIDNNWLLVQNYDYNSVNQIPKKDLINISLKLKMGEVNFPEIKKKHFMFVYNQKYISILFVSDDDKIVDSLRIDVEFYSQILDIPCVKICASFTYDAFKCFAFTENVIIQKVYEKDK